MIDLIKYYYDLDIIELDSDNHFKIDNRDYYLYRYDFEKKKIYDILMCINSVVQSGECPNRIIENRNGEYLTLIDDCYYLLVEVMNKDELFDIYYIMNFSTKNLVNNYNSSLCTYDWTTLWSKKINYLEYQTRELALDKEIIKNSFSYYIGLAELAIMYAFNTKIKFPNYMTSLSISHRRIYYPNNRLNYYNPLSYVIDMPIRDVAEYIKGTFFCQWFRKCNN